MRSLIRIILLFLPIIGHNCVFLQQRSQKEYASSVSGYLQNQQDVFLLFHNVFTPEWDSEEIVEYVRSFNVFSSELYQHLEAVNLFQRLRRDNKLLDRGDPFTSFADKHIKEAILIFQLYQSLKPSSDFFRVALWMKHNINPNVFIYSTITYLIANGYESVIPAPYEVNPFYFFDSEIIRSGQKLINQRSNANEFRLPPIKIRSRDLHLSPNGEDALNYFRNDLDLNSFYYYLQMAYPPWLGKQFPLKKDRRGELFLYEHQQLLARYNLERIGNGMKSVEDLKTDKANPSSHFPSMEHSNGRKLLERIPFYYPFGRERQIKNILVMEKKLRDFIVNGQLKIRNITINFRNESSIDQLGNLLQGNVDQPNLSQFKNYFVLLKTIFGGHSHLENSFILTNALHHEEMQLRDPVYYQLIKRIVDLYRLAKDNSRSYSEKELGFAGVKIESVEAQKIETYFQDLPVDISNSLLQERSSGPTKGQNPIRPRNITRNDIKYKQEKRIVTVNSKLLHHDPFSYRMDIQSLHSSPAIIRAFLGPANDDSLSTFNWNTERFNFFEIDKFKVDLVEGSNAIYRISTKFNGFIGPRSSMATYAQHLRDIFDNELNLELHNREAICGFPQRLLFPKTSPQGVLYRLYFIVSKYVDHEPLNGEPIEACGFGSGRRYLDSRPLGFPFDKPIAEQSTSQTTFMLPSNAYEMFVNVTHRANKYYSGGVGRPEDFVGAT